MRLVRLSAAALLAAGSLGLAAAPAHADEECTPLELTSASGPCYVVRPSAGSVGTTVHFRVRVAPQHQEGWLADWKRHPSLRLFQWSHGTDGAGCVFIVPSSASASAWHVVRLEPYDPDSAVNRKAVVGWLTIGDTGRCEGGESQPVTRGDYLLSTGWRHGAFARFRVEPGELPKTGSVNTVMPGVAGGLLVLLGTSLLLASRVSRSARPAPR